MEMTFSFQQIILDALGLLLVGLISVATKKFCSWVDEKVNNTKISEKLYTATTIVEDSVKSTYQTYVEALKDKNMFNEENQLTALNMAKESAKAQLSEPVKALIIESFGDLEAWLDAKIHATLYTLKK